MADEREYGTGTKLDRVVRLTEETQKELSEIVKVTKQQSEMIEKQQEMMDNLWKQVEPILKDRRKKEELKNELFSKLLTGGVWAFFTGVLFLMWQGVKFYLKVGGDSDGPN